jgi:hypothetical protein
MSSPADELLALARANDDRCGELLLRCDDPETLGELIVAVHATGTAAAARAVSEALLRPFRRGAWQGWKRVFKVLERRLLDDGAEPAAHDLDLFAAQLFTMDLAPAHGFPIQPRTREYMKRRCYRAVKALAHRRGARFRALLERLAPRYGRLAEGYGSPLFERVLRWTGVEPWSARPTRFVPPVDNAFLAAPAAETDLLALSAEDLVRAAPAPAAPATPPLADALAATPPPWKGPIFVERWLEDPVWLVGLLETTVYEPLAGAVARLCEERAGERLLSVDLERFYGLLQHPMGAVWRLALSQVAARAHRERLRWGELARLLDRTARASSPDWSVIADLLAVLDEERAEAEWTGLLPCLHDLVLKHPDAPGVGPVIDFLRRRLLDRLRPPLFGWSTALSLAEARRPDVRALARDLVATCADLAVLDATLLERLVLGSLPDEDPELVHRVLVRPRALPGGYRPSVVVRTTSAGPTSTPWPLSRCAQALDRAPEPGFQALRRALLAFEETCGPGGGLEPLVAQVLIARDERRTRALGLELLGGALARGALPVTALPRLLASSREDVVVWARERLDADAAAGRLPNEALYRVLDLGATDAQAFGRDLVRRHLERFAVAELVVFCAESPDAATADLGIGLYEERLKGAGSAFDLRALVPMFRILLYRPATARAEKERLYATLRRWALEAAENARLVVDVTSELRRTESKVDRSRVVQLLALVRERFPVADVAVPFTTTAVFSGHGREATWTSR